jgi:hypothetical protein
VLGMGMGPGWSDFSLLTKPAQAAPQVNPLTGKRPPKRAPQIYRTKA